MLKIQSRTSSSTLSLLVSAAINELLNILFTMMSNVGIGGLGTRGLLTPDDKGGEIEVIAVGGGFAVREEVGELKADPWCERSSGECRVDSQGEWSS